jgi:hypothetical protein
VVVIHQIAPYRESFYIVMEYVDGGSLAELLASRKRFDPTEAVSIIRPAAEGLAYAHRQGVIHRDIKPMNIMLTQGGVVKLADLGLARRADDAAAALEEAGRAYGTPYYISPEQARGDARIDFRADLYSLGATLYEMVAGRPPFVAENPRDILRMHILNPLPDPRQFVPDVPESLCRLLTKAMAKDPAARFQTADEFIAALDGLDFLPVAEAVEPPPAAADRRQGRRVEGASASRPGAARAGEAGREGTGGLHAPPKAKVPVVPLVAVGGIVVALGIGIAVWQLWPQDKVEGPRTLRPSETGLVVPANSSSVAAGATGAAYTPATRRQPAAAGDRPLTPTEYAAMKALHAAHTIERTTTRMGPWKRDILANYQGIIDSFPNTPAAEEAKDDLRRLAAPDPAMPLHDDPLPPEPKSATSKEAEAPKPPEPEKTVVSAEAKKPEETPKLPEPAPREGGEKPGDVVKPRADDTVFVHARAATCHTKALLTYEFREGADNRDNIGMWNNQQDWVSWEAEFPAAGTYEVSITFAADKKGAGGDYFVKIGPNEVNAKVHSTDLWNSFITEKIGTIRVSKAGRQTIEVRCRKLPPRLALMNLQALTFRRIGD